MQLNSVRLVLIKELSNFAISDRICSWDEEILALLKKHQWQWSAIARHLQQLQQITFFRGGSSVFSKIGSFVLFWIIPFMPFKENQFKKN